MFFRWDLPFLPHIAIDSTQNEGNNLGRKTQIKKQRNLKGNALVWPYTGCSLKIILNNSFLNVFIWISFGFDN